MALTVIVEDGTGLENSNSYITVAECDTYHEAHLYATAWTGATADQKKQAVVMATRTIEAAVIFTGYRRGQDQALEWPRNRVPRQGIDSYVSVGMGQNLGPYYPENELPAILKNATCEMARELLKGDRTADDDAKGVKKLALGNGAIDIEFNPSDRKIAVTDEIIRMLAPITTVRGQGMMRRVERVQ